MRRLLFELGGALRFCGGSQKRAAPFGQQRRVVQRAEFLDTSYGGFQFCGTRAGTSHIRGRCPADSNSADRHGCPIYGRRAVARRINVGLHPGMSNPKSTCRPASISQRIARLRYFGDAVNTAHSFRAGSTSSNIVPSPPGTEFSLPSFAVEPAQVSQAVYGVQQLIVNSGMAFERGQCLSPPVGPLDRDVRDAASLPLGCVEIQGNRAEGDTELRGRDSVRRIPVYVMLPLDTVRWSWRRSHSRAGACWPLSRPASPSLSPSAGPVLQSASPLAGMPLKNTVVVEGSERV